MMKFVIVAVVSICFATAKPNGLIFVDDNYLNKITLTGSSSSKATVKTGLQAITTEPKNALVHLVKDGEYLVGAALLSDKCVLVPYSSVEDYIEKKLETNNLFVGTGQPFKKYCKSDLHNVLKIVGDKSIQDISCYIALVIFQVNENGLPLHLKYIPIAKETYWEYYSPYTNLINEIAVGWDRKYEKLDYYHEIHLDTIYVHSTFGVVVDEELFHDVTEFYGGFITRKGTLAGIAGSKGFIPGETTDITIHFIPVKGNSILMRNAADDLFHVLDIPVRNAVENIQKYKI